MEAPSPAAKTAVRAFTQKKGRRVKGVLPFKFQMINKYIYRIFFITLKSR